MEIYTIGFTRRTAANFFGTLKAAGVRRLLDIRIHNSSQLSGFAKRDDLAYFLSELAEIPYQHETLLAPTAELLGSYRNKAINWDTYASEFLALLSARHVESCIDRRLFDERTVLLCSEPKPDRCHRRLVVEYLADRWGGLETVHL